MKLLFSLIFLLLFFLNGCTITHKHYAKEGSDYATYGISEHLIKSWQLDPNGCNGLRNMYKDSLLTNANLLKSSDTLIEKLFGKPDEETKCCYYYNISPNCDSAGRINKEADNCGIIFYFNDHRKVESIDLNCE